MKWIPPAAGAFTFLALILPLPANGMAFCCPNRITPPLRQELANAQIALVGDVCRIDQDGDGSTEFHISHFLKTPPLFVRKKIMHLPLALPSRGTWILFAEVFQGQLDVYRALPVTPAALEYLQSMPAIKDGKSEPILRYCFPHLEDADEIIAGDAQKEFAQVNAVQIASAAHAFSPEKLRAWLNNTKLPPARLNLYGRLLGYCGDRHDAELLDRLVRQRAASKEEEMADGFVEGYILLRPRQGWEYLREFLGDASRTFSFRYSLLRTIRFLHEIHPDLIPARERIAALGMLLEQPDIADLPIDQLRKWRCWDLSDRILVLYSRRSHATPIIRRAVVRYALQCPELKAAVFVAQVRHDDPEFVASREEELQLEQ